MFSLQPPQADDGLQNRLWSWPAGAPSALEPGRLRELAAVPPSLVLDLDPEVAAAVRRHFRLVSLAARAASRSASQPRRMWAPAASGRGCLWRHGGVHRHGRSQSELHRRERPPLFRGFSETAAAAAVAAASPASSLPPAVAGRRGSRGGGKHVVFAPVLATDMRTGAAVPHRPTDKKEYALRGGEGGADENGDGDGAARERSRAEREERRRRRAAEIWAVDAAATAGDEDVVMGEASKGD